MISFFAGFYIKPKFSTESKCPGLTSTGVLSVDKGGTAFNRGTLGWQEDSCIFFKVVYSTWSERTLRATAGSAECWAIWLKTQTASAGISDQLGRR